MRKLLGLALLACFSLSGCGTETTSQDGRETSLEFLVNTGEETLQASLSCPGGNTTGYLAEVEDACTVVQEQQEILETVLEPEQACTLEYGGPHTATLQGTLNGKPLERTFARNNGCRITQWDALIPLLPAAPPTLILNGSTP